MRSLWKVYLSHLIHLFHMASQCPARTPQIVDALRVLDEDHWTSLADSSRDTDDFAKKKKKKVPHVRLARQFSSTYHRKWNY